MSLQYDHVILVRGYPVWTAVNNHNMYVQYQVAHLPTLARKCDIQYWLPCDVDGWTEGQSHGYQNLLDG